LAQIWLWHGACPILSSEPVGMSHNQFPPPQHCHEWSDVDPDRWTLEFVQQFQELCSLWVSLCWNTCVGLKIWSPKSCWITVKLSVALFPRLAQNFMHIHCTFLWSIVKIATGHVHNSKQTRVKTAQVHPSTCNSAHWLNRHGSPTIYWCFVLPQLLYRWRHQSGIFWIPPRIYNMTVFRQRQEMCNFFHDSYTCNDWPCGTQVVHEKFLLISSVIWWFTYKDYILLSDC
jgi:hypothetical protein